MKTISLLVSWLLLLGLGTSCHQVEEAPSKKAEPSPLFRAVTSEESGIHFSNDLSPDYDRNILEYNYFYNGGGVAIGDVNNDGRPDIYFTGNMVSSRLYLNQGPGEVTSLRFADATEQAGVTTEGWATGVSFVDINQDGFLDIYVCRSTSPEASARANLLFINNGASSHTPSSDKEKIPSVTFTEQAAQYGLADTGYSTQAVFLDYDQDHDLDMYLLTVDQDKRNPNYPRPEVNDGTHPSTDRLYRNEGIGPEGHPTFTEVSAQAGIRHQGYGLGVAVNDFNQDGWPDIYVANDFIFDDLLYINQQDGTFAEQAADYLKHQSRFSMGVDAADVNNDTYVDLMVLDMMPDDNERQKLMSTGMNYNLFQLALNQGYQPQYPRNMLQLNNGPGPDGHPTFSEIGYLANVYQTDWSWSALFGDYDNDGYQDLYITNGIPKDITNLDFIKYRDTRTQGSFDYEALKKQLLTLMDALPEVDKPNVMYRNRGGDPDNALEFSDATARWGLFTPACSNGAAYADLDGDGDLDLVVNNLNKPAFLFENQADTLLNHHYLNIQLVGEAPNLQGIGAEVTLAYAGNQLHRTLTPYRGFQSSVDPRLHFGLGKVDLVDTVRVQWPDGTVQHVYNVESDQTLVIRYIETGEAVEKTQERSTPQFFTEVSEAYGIQYEHQENPFVDFHLDPLLPRKYSQSGPGMAVGDVNGDGLEDFAVGGAKEQPGTLFIQTPQGQFDKRYLPDPDYEDTGLLFFDADNDRDLDLYVVSGGSEFNAYTAPYQDRLYVNDGQGKFTRSEQELPKTYSSGSVVTAADADQDGDLDLFVGGRVVPGQYPIPPRSYLLRNDTPSGGEAVFTDVTAEVCPALVSPGLVTDALWTDFDNDHQIDLIVVGEWMSVMFFKNDRGQLTDVTPSTGLTHMRGWWNSLVAQDFDQDGDTDYVVGNLGLNSKYQASPEEPVMVYAKDFDQNGSLDPVTVTYLSGHRYPYHSLDEMVGQMVFMRRQFPRYADFAQATFEEVFTAQQLQGAHQVKSEEFRSVYLENQGNGTFSKSALPLVAQFAPLYGMLSEDYTGDGYPDLLITGNSYAPNLMAGRHDALTGYLLQGDGQGHFEPIPGRESGFWVDGDAKGLARLHTPSGPLILSTANDGLLKVFTFTPTPSESIVSVRSTDAWAVLELDDGTRVKQEFYYGSTYLSQSTRTLPLPSDVSSGRIYDFQGVSRPLTIDQPDL